MYPSQNDVLPFGELQMQRSPLERLSEEVHASIPALAKLSSAALAAGNKLGQEARNSLFYGMSSDPGLRALKVELAVERIETMNVAEPDLAWLRAAEIPEKDSFGSKDLQEDVWLKPDGP